MDVYILNLTGHSTQMCYSLNIPPILSGVVLTESDTNRHLRGTSALHNDLTAAKKMLLNKSDINLLRNVCVSANVCADI